MSIDSASLNKELDLRQAAVEPIERPGLEPLLAAIRQDSREAPQLYLAETEVRYGGE